MPAPAAPALLPRKLSASGYTSLVACPYQFFATRMLGLSGLEELSEQLEKRDYGDWLHQILHLYHVGLRDQGIGLERRAAYLQEISTQIFATELARSGERVWAPHFPWPSVGRVVVKGDAFAWVPDTTVVAK